MCIVSTEGKANTSKAQAGWVRVGVLSVLILCNAAKNSADTSNAMLAGSHHRHLRLCVCVSVCVRACVCVLFLFCFSFPTFCIVLVFFTLDRIGT